MRSLIGMGFVLLMTAQVVAAQQPAAGGGTPKVAKDLDTSSMVLARVGYFLASDPAYKNIYGNGMVFGGELRAGSKRLGKHLGIWGEGNHRTRKGAFSFTKEPTTVSVTAIEGGVLYRFMPKTASPYAGAGVGYYLYNENNTPVGKATQNKVGFCAVAGFSAVVARTMIVDVRLKYSVVNMQPADFAIKVGGLTAGLGLGVRF
jgi:opacity protein-like surface antigen